MKLDEWPDCPVEGCANKVCLRLKSKYCFPHTMSETNHAELLEQMRKRAMQRFKEIADEAFAYAYFGETKNKEGEYDKQESTGRLNYEDFKRIPNVFEGSSQLIVRNCHARITSRHISKANG